MSRGSPRAYPADVHRSVEGTVDYKVVNNMCTFLLGDHLNLLCDGCLQCINGKRVALIDVVLEEHSEKKSFFRSGK